MVTVFGHQARAQLLQPAQLGPGSITPQVQMDTVLHDFLLWHQLEAEPRLPVRPLDHDARVVLGIKDPLTAQPGKFYLIVGSDLVTIQGSSPEPGDRRGMMTVKDNIVKPGHGRNRAMLATP